MPEQMVWFDQLHSVNENAFDAICCKILRSIYGMMEKSMTSDKDLSFEKLFCDYLVKEEGFEEIIQFDFAEGMKNNQSCGIYL